MKNSIYVIIFGLVVFGIFLAVPRTNNNTKTRGETMTDNTNTTDNSDQKTTDSADFSTAGKAVIKTDKGDIEVELYPNDAPQTVQNFVTLAKRGYYNNLTFHRVEPGFVIQGGDPSGNGTGGTSIYGAKFNDELNKDTASYKAGYKEGVLAMANSGPNTNGSQFFIMLADNDSLPKNYSIFGKVTSGMDVVKKVVVGTVITAITPQ